MGGLARGSGVPARCAAMSYMQEFLPVDRDQYWQQPIPSAFVSMPEVPANHRSTKLAQIFFADLISFIDSDLHVPVV
jgi:hypothetical protein